MNQNPACYGISICFYPESATCKACPVMVDCSKEAKLEALQIAEEYLVPKLLTRFKDVEVPYTPPPTDCGLAYSGKPPSAKYSLTLNDAKAMSRMNAKARRVADVLLRRGIDIKLGLALRSLPFRDGLNHWLKLGCQQLLEGGFTPEQMTDRFQAELGVARQSARSYTSTLISLLTSLEVMHCEAGRYTLRHY